MNESTHDNVPIDQAARQTTPPVPASNPAGSTEYYCDGELDEAAFYPFLLSADRIAIHYNAAVATTPWFWNVQQRVELFTSNLLGQNTTHTDGEGNIDVTVRYPQNDPEGAAQYLVPGLSNKQYGWVKGNAKGGNAKGDIHQFDRQIGSQRRQSMKENGQNKAPDDHPAQRGGAGSTQNYCDGELDEAAFYPSLLSADRIAIHYNAAVATTPWFWNVQPRAELFTSNLLGQNTTHTDGEGNIDVTVRYPQNDPEGAAQYLVPGLSNKQYGWVKEIHRDADPATVMTLLGPDADMVAFTGGKIPRINSPGVYLDLVTGYKPSGTSGSCPSCAYDPLGNPLAQTDARGHTTTFDRNELGEAWRTTSPAPYNYQSETSFDPNRNVIQVDTQDVVVQMATNDPTDPAYGKFIPTGSGATANLPTMPGPGGAVRPGWFSNLFTFDLLDNQIEKDIDATGSSPASLVTGMAYDFNQNLVTVTLPLDNTIEFDYDERNLKIAIRRGGPNGSVIIMAYDGNKNLIDVIGPATRGTPAQTNTAVIGDAFGGSASVTFSGDWLVENIFDGFDRKVSSTDAAGGMRLSTFDPGGREIAFLTLGSPGGPTPTDRSGSTNVPLASGEARFDEGGRKYEAQRDVFLDNGTYYKGVPGELPSGRQVTHTGGGLATNSTVNDHTDTVVLTAGGRSYVLSRTVLDRADRTTGSAADNGALTAITLDGAGRAPTLVDALGNSLQRTFDANGNVVFTTKVEKCTISGSIAPESFSSAFAIDVLNRTIVTMQQGPDGSLNTNWVACCTWPVLPPTLFTFAGFDSRNNRTNLVDPKQNTTIWEFDGASRLLRAKRHLRPSGDGTTPINDTVLTQLTWDANSNTTRLVDDNGGTTASAFDLLDRNTLMTFHDGSTRTNQFDPANDVVGYIDENGSYFANTFDVLGRNVNVAIVPAAGVAGNSGLTGTPGTIAQAFQFDGLSRPTFCRDTAGTVGGGSVTNADVGFTYDSIDRNLEEQQTYSGDTRFVTRHGWTSLPATGFMYPNNRQIALGFDALYRKNAINEGSASGANVAAWQFFGGRTATVTLGNGIITSFMNNAQTRSATQLGQTTPPWGDITTDHLGFDGSRRPIGKRHILPSGATLVGFSTQYDPSTNKLFERALHAESRSNLYTNDSMERLLSYQRGILGAGGATITTPIALPNTDSQRAYDLDGLGNWPNTAFIPEGGTLETELRTHNKLNQITAFGAGPATTPVLYDNGNNTAPNATRGNGNIINDGLRVNIFDALNRLVSVAKVGGGSIGAYVYDAIGRRIVRNILGSLSGTVPSGVSRYLLDGWQIIEDLAATTGSAKIQYVWGQYIDELIQLKALSTIGPQSLAAGNYYPLSDLLYRSAALTNESAAIVEAYDTDAYGNTLLFSGSGTDGLWFTDDDLQAVYSASRYVFTGREYDAESGMYFYRLRYYVPVFGRFVGRDPLLYSAGAGLYQLLASRPVEFVDPMGLRITIPGAMDINGDVRWGVRIVNALKRICPCVGLEPGKANNGVSTVVVESASINLKAFCECYGDHLGGCKVLLDLLTTDKEIAIRPAHNDSDEVRPTPNGSDVFWNSRYVQIPRTVYDSGVRSDYVFDGVIPTTYLAHELFHAYDYSRGTDWNLEPRAVRFENQVYLELGGEGSLRSQYNADDPVSLYDVPMIAAATGRDHLGGAVEACGCNDACAGWVNLMAIQGKCS